MYLKSCSRHLRSHSHVHVSRAPRHRRNSDKLVGDRHSDVDVGQELLEGMGERIHSDNGHSDG